MIGPISDSTTHLNAVVRALKRGGLVPFLGAGANLCARPKEVEWRPGQTEYLPSSWELAGHLAKEYQYPYSDEQDLARISQYIALTDGPRILYQELHKLFDADYTITILHRFLASLPGTLRRKGYLGHGDFSQRLLIVTTNYDDLVERAFLEIGEPFHVIAYETEGTHKGKFLHYSSRGTKEIILTPKEYTGLRPDSHAVILKIHGAVHRERDREDSFMITEDHYIEYLAHQNVLTLLPIPLSAILLEAQFLFLGYGLKDWNVRAILRSLHNNQGLGQQSWAVQLDPKNLDRKLWDKYDVEIINWNLGDYIQTLQNLVRELPDAEVSA